MAAGYVTKVVGDGNGGTFSARFWCPDTSASPQLLFPAGAITDGAGNLVDFTATSATFPLPVTPVSGLTTAMTGTTSTAVTGVGAAGSGKFNYITSIVVGNSHATVGTFVEFQDGSGGSTFYTVPAAAVYGGAVIPLPTPLKQPTANTALYCKNTTTGANVIVSVCGFQA